MTPKINGYSPWGSIHTVKSIIDGIWFVTTASHGGFYVKRELWNQMPVFMKETRFSKGGWFEEDCDWVLPVLFFKQHFPQEDIELAMKIAETYHPQAFEFCRNVIPKVV